MSGSVEMSDSALNGGPIGVSPHDHCWESSVGPREIRILKRVVDRCLPLGVVEQVASINIAASLKGEVAIVDA